MRTRDRMTCTKKGKYEDDDNNHDYDQKIKLVKELIAALLPWFCLLALSLCRLHSFHLIFHLKQSQSIRSVWLCMHFRMDDFFAFSSCSPLLLFHFIFDVTFWVFFFFNFFFGIVLLHFKEHLLLLLAHKDITKMKSMNREASVCERARARSCSVARSKKEEKKNDAQRKQQKRKKNSNISSTNNNNNLYG